MALQQLFAMPPRLYQRHPAFFHHLAPALALAYLFLQVDRATGAFPAEWRLFLAGLILLGGLVLPLAGYVLFTLAVAYPLYTISIYVAALALTILLPLTFFILHYVPGVVLVLILPLLATHRLALLGPFLAGLWWAEWGGVIAGLTGALWLKLFAGMCNTSPDLLQMPGEIWATDELIARFHTANSFQTLLWIGAPLAPDAQTLLLHILEILGWGLAGYGVGWMRRRMEGAARPGLGLLAAISAGLIGVALGSLGLPLALHLRETPALSTSHLANFLLQCGQSSVMTVALYGIARYMTRPAAPLPYRRGRASRQRPGPPEVAVPASPPVSPEPAPPAWARPVAEPDEPNDIIMIDLD